MSHKERIVQVQKGQGFAVEVFDHGLSMKSALSELKIRENGSLEMVYIVRLNFGVIGKIIGELFIGPVIFVGIRKLVKQFAGN